MSLAMPLACAGPIGFRIQYAASVGDHLFRFVVVLNIVVTQLACSNTPNVGGGPGNALSPEEQPDGPEGLRAIGVLIGVEAAL